MDVYTMKTWKKDGTFKAEPGQEITEQIYNTMLNCLPPKTLPQGKAREALDDYGIPVHAGFLMGQEDSTGPDGKPLYMAFGMNNYGSGARFYYLGLAPAQARLNGSYYFMDCMNAFVNNGLFPAAEFADDAEAIRTAANYEATLYRYEYRDGERISSRVLYEPRYC